jgi:hypothetical protein
VEQGCDSDEGATGENCDRNCVAFHRICLPLVSVKPWERTLPAQWQCRGGTLGAAR